MKLTLLHLILPLLLLSCTGNQKSSVKISEKNKKIKFQNAEASLTIGEDLSFGITFTKNKRTFPVTDPSVRGSSVSVSDYEGNNVPFRIISSSVNVINDFPGNGKEADIEAFSEDGKVSCTVSISAFDEFPGLFLVQSCFRNKSRDAISLRGYILNQIKVERRDEKEWMTFQGAAYEWGQDFIFGLPDNFARKNYMGLNALKAGAGIPLVDIWNKDFGIALACIGNRPQDISLPVHADSTAVNLAIEEDSEAYRLYPGDSLITVRSAIILHEGDFYEAVRKYSGLIHLMLPGFLKPPEYAYQPEWCTWGYGRQFNAGKILDKTASLKSLGIRSVIIDDGWSLNHGDWIPDPGKFPHGDKDFVRLIDSLHKEGFRVWLWWVPGYTDSASSVAKLHPDWLVLNKDGSVHRSYALCPAYEPVREHFRSLVTKFTREYKLDGFKLDFGEINTAPPCYNPAHHHKDPYESYRATPGLFSLIHETAKQNNPGILLEYCACGIPPNIYHLPYINLAVTSDPSIGQITRRIKMYKALMGPDFPVLEEYCGVLAGPLYQLVMGTGGVPGTFSTYLDDYHKKWLGIYREKELSKGEYLNLYDIGFDYPEGHVIKKNGRLYYAFYTHPWNQIEATRWYRFGKEFDSRTDAMAMTEFDFPQEEWSGRLKLRGLDKAKNYRIINYENNREIADIKGDTPYLDTDFVNYILLEVVPI
jgi:alpha-galactosidase